MSTLPDADSATVVGLSLGHVTALQLAQTSSAPRTSVHPPGVELVQSLFALLMLRLSRGLVNSLSSNLLLYLSSLHL